MKSNLVLGGYGVMEIAYLAGILLPFDEFVHEVLKLVQIFDLGIRVAPNILHQLLNGVMSQFPFLPFIQLRVRFHGICPDLAGGSDILRAIHGIMSRSFNHFLRDLLDTALTGITATLLGTSASTTYISAKAFYITFDLDNFLVLGRSRGRGGLRGRAGLRCFWAGSRRRFGPRSWALALGSLERAFAYSKFHPEKTQFRDSSI